ncbi:hypothetical protein G7054_g14322 [Neopestalotiopsis clavispora]|nr:hypothetical protein G7054_g14322 [Neopestalotiopsis clavispora]
MLEDLHRLLQSVDNDCISVKGKLVDDAEFSNTRMVSTAFDQGVDGYTLDIHPCEQAPTEKTRHVGQVTVLK